MAGDFLAHRRNGALQVTGNSAKRVTGGNAARYFFALGKAEHSGISTSSCRPYTACGLQNAMNRRGAPAQCTSDPKDRLANLISTPEFLALRIGRARATSQSHAEHLLG
jgi:hypothetical protein